MTHPTNCYLQITMVLLITIVGSGMKERGNGLALKFFRRLNLKDEQ